MIKAVHVNKKGFFFNCGVCTDEFSLKAEITYKNKELFFEIQLFVLYINFGYRHE